MIIGNSALVLHCSNQLQGFLFINTERKKKPKWFEIGVLTTKHTTAKSEALLGPIAFFNQNAAALEWLVAGFTIKK